MRSFAPGLMAPLGLALLLGLGAARAEEAPDSTAGFERAYAASYWQFDACGDALSGLAWRRALSDKVARCPLPAMAKARFRDRAAAQRRKSRDMLERLIEDHGGLPPRLAGMTRTCREQADTPDYQALRARLEAYAAGRAGVDTVVTAPCDAAEVAP